MKHSLPWGEFEAKPMWTKTDDKTTDKKIQFEDIFDLSSQLNLHMPRHKFTELELHEATHAFV